MGGNPPDSAREDLGVPAGNTDNKLRVVMCGQAADAADDICQGFYNRSTIIAVLSARGLLEFVSIFVSCLNLEVRMTLSHVTETFVGGREGKPQGRE